MYVFRKGDGIPIVLIHGVGGDQRVWYPIVRSFPQGFKLLAPDLPGHGRSGGEAIGSVMGYAEAVLKGLGDEISGGILVGLSMGGGVAIGAYLLSPHRFKGLVLVSSAFRLPVIAHDVGRERMCGKIYLSQRLRKMCVKELRKVPDEVLRLDRKAAAYDLLDVAHGVKVPVLFVHGSMDTLVNRELVMESFRRVDHPSLISLPSSHMLSVESPKALTKALLWWLSRLRL